MMKDPITVVICLDHASLKGGQERVAFDSAVGLKRLGHRPIVFTAFGPIAPLLADAGIETICLDQQSETDAPSKLLVAVRNVWNVPVARALDILLASLPKTGTLVHVHGWAGALSSAIAGPIARSGLPALFTIHDYSMFCPNGGFYNYQKQEICTLTPLSASCWKTNCDTRGYARKLVRNTRLLTATDFAALPSVFQDYIAISDLQQAIVTPFLPKTATLHRVSNPISVPDLGLRTGPVGGDVIFVGRLAPEKGVILFAEAARQIGMIPHFIGDGPLKSEIATRFPEARLDGWRDQKDVHRTLRAARALVFPSLWYEGLGLSVLEAQALGVPAIVSDACAGRESIQDGVTGLLFKSGDVADLARALVATYDDTTMQAMSAAAYHRFWAAPPTLDGHVQSLTKLYSGVLNRRECASTMDARARSGNASA